MVTLVSIPYFIVQINVLNNMLMELKSQNLLWNNRVKTVKKKKEKKRVGGVELIVMPKKQKGVSPVCITWMLSD